MKRDGSSSSEIEPEAAPPRWRAWEFLFLLAICAAVIGINWGWMAHLGLEYDEAESLPAAVKMVSGSPERLVFPGGLYVFHRPIPFMIAAYIGALDAYIYAVSFALFGVTTMTLRMTNLALTIAIFAGAYTLTRSFRSRAAAVLTILFLATDTEFLVHALMNYGPLLAQIVCASFAMVGIQRFVRGQGSHNLAISAFLLGLGLSEKMTFVLFLGAVPPALAALYGKAALRRLGWKNSSAAVGCFALGALPVILYTIASLGEIGGFAKASVSMSQHWTDVLSVRLHQFHELVAGISSMKMSGNPVPPSLTRFSILWPLLCVAVAGSVVLGVLGRYRLIPATLRPPRVIYGFLVLIGGVLFLSAFFPDSGRIHHLMLAYPFAHCVAAITLVWLWEVVRPRSIAAARAGVAALGVLLAMQAVSSGKDLLWLSAVTSSTGGRGFHSARVQDLTRWVASQPDTHFVFGSWGLYRPVFALSGGKSSCTELAFILFSPPSGATLDEVKRVLKREHSMFIFFHDGSGAMDHLFTVAQSIGLRPRLVKQFSERDASPLYDAFVVEPVSRTPVGNPTWTSVSATAIRAIKPPLQGFSFRQIGASGVEMTASTGPADEGHPLGMELPLSSPSAYFRLALSSSHWDRFTGIHIEVAGSDGAILTTWDRVFRWYAMTQDEEAIEIGPNLYPDSYFYAEKAKGKPMLLRLWALPKSAGSAIDLSVRELAAESAVRLK